MDQLVSEASDAYERQQYAVAGALFDRIAAIDRDPIWLQRAGEAYRRANDLATAVARFHDAAVRFARGGATARAAALCHLIGQLLPGSRATERLLAELEGERRIPRKRTPRPRPADTKRRR